MKRYDIADDILTITETHPVSLLKDTRKRLSNGSVVGWRWYRADKQHFIVRYHETSGGSVLMQPSGPWTSRYEAETVWSGALEILERET